MIMLWQIQWSRPRQTTEVCNKFTIAKNDDAINKECTLCCFRTVMHVCYSIRLIMWLSIGYFRPIL